MSEYSIRQPPEEYLTGFAVWAAGEGFDRDGWTGDVGQLGLSFTLRVWGQNLFVHVKNIQIR